MAQSATLTGIEFPSLPACYVWSVTDYLGYPDGAPLDEVYRKGQRVLLAIHRTYRFGPFHFSLRVGRVLAYTVDPRAEREYLQATVADIWESFQRRLIADAV